MKGAIKNNRAAGVPLNSVTVRALLLGVLLASTAAFVLQPKAEGGLGLQLSRPWVRKWLHSELKMSFRRMTTAAQKLPADHELQTLRATQRIAYLVEQYYIPPDLIINFDQTGLHLQPTAGTSTFEVKGSKLVPVEGADDKRAITAVIGSTMSGLLLPLQLIFQGATDRVHPSTAVSTILEHAGHHITHSDNHWSNLETMKEYINEVVQPFVSWIIESMELPADQHAILLIDAWSVHRSDAFQNWMRDEFPHLHIVFIPGGTTGIFQPADVALNRPFKHFVRTAYVAWAAASVSDQIRNGVAAASKFRVRV